MILYSPQFVADKHSEWMVCICNARSQSEENPFVAKYLIQNTIWWIEFTGLDGIREDTYPYSDQEYLSEWAKNNIRGISRV